MLSDKARIFVQAGRGGDGSMSFRREAHVPRGGPDGGDGGRGGAVVLVCDDSLRDLQAFRRRAHFKAPRARHGEGSNRIGADGETLEVGVPPGTQVTLEDGTVHDLVVPGTRIVVAKGGAGGRGNKRFATSTRQAPRHAQPGKPGEQKTLRLELRMLADAGLLGFPNVGKSTLIRAVSAARPRVADYPFTTLVPHLGVVRVDEDASFVLADVPGLIPGAHAGQGLGTRFLRHLSRTAVLVHLLDVSGLSGRDPVDDYDVLCRELALASPALGTKPQIVVAGRIDLAETRERLPEVRARFAERGIDLHAVSGVTGEGTRELVQRIAAAVWAERRRSADAGDDGAAETVE